MFQRNPGHAHRIPIYEVARATSAAPTYFDPITIQNRKFGDGGFGCNNPSMELMMEVGQRHGGRNAIHLFVSIGTGESVISRFAEWPGLAELYTYLKAAKKLATDSQRVADDMVFQQNEGLPYHRFNVPVKDNDSVIGGKVLSEMKMDEWKGKGGLKRRAENETLKKIREVTEKYCNIDSVRHELHEVAEKLVSLRRERAKTAFWSLASTGLRFRCAVPACPKSQKLRYSEINLRKHISVNHNEYFDALIKKEAQQARASQARNQDAQQGQRTEDQNLEQDERDEELKMARIDEMVDAGKCPY